MNIFNSSKSHQFQCRTHEINNSLDLQRALITLIEYHFLDIQLSASLI